MESEDNENKDDANINIIIIDNSEKLYFCQCLSKPLIYHWSMSCINYNDLNQ